MNAIFCDSCGEEVKPRASDPLAHVVHIEGWKMKRAYDLCDVCRPQFFRLMRRMVGGETEASNVNLRTQSVTFATKAKAEAANVHSQDRVGGMA